VDLEAVAFNETERAEGSVTRILVVGIALASIPSALFAQNIGNSLAPSAVIGTYCVSCHSGRAREGGFSFDRIDVNRPAEDPDVWERVVRQLRARAMPAMGAPRPDSHTYEATIFALTSALDRAAQATVVPWTDQELAVRLATLIWNAEPDQPLLEAAGKGRLRDAHALEAQVRQMLSDPRSSALVAGFFSPWLGLDQLTTMRADNQLFPEFDDELRAALRRETELFVESQLRADRNPLDLWTANYSFLNERLARHYGVPNVSGRDYRRVTWPSPDRAGLLAQGSILTLTSYPYKAYPVDTPTTSPAQRAKWIRTRFLGVDPPATLPGIPGRDFPFVKHTPLVKQSRAFPATPCLMCHRSFFPLSYGLENFDALGRWRTDYGPGPIDASGSMVDGTTFNGPLELRRALLERGDAFLSVITEKLMAYAIGGTTAIDRFTPSSRMPVVRAALSQAGGLNSSWSSLIAAIVKTPVEPR
jgi:uncharacterized protein DUF1592/uncharacterized protein DUF1588/uncharacterized protein DUF1585